MIPDGGLGKLIAEGEVFFRFLELKNRIIFGDSEAVGTVVLSSYIKTSERCYQLG